MFIVENTILSLWKLWDSFTLDSMFSVSRNQLMSWYDSSSFFSFFPGIWPSIFACHRLIPTNISTTLQFVPSVVTTMYHLEKWPYSIWRKPKEGLQNDEGVDETYHTSWIVCHLSFLGVGLEIHEIEDCLEKIGCDIVYSNHGKKDYGFCFSPTKVLHNLHSGTGTPVETPRPSGIWFVIG